MLKALETAQKNYFSRKGENLPEKQQQKPAENDDDVNAEFFNFSLARYPYYKMGKMCKTRTIKRFFLLKAEEITYFENIQDIKPKKSIKITSTSSLIQHQSESEGFGPWHDRNAEYRILVIFDNRSPLYVYSEQPGLLSNLNAHLNLCRNPQLLKSVKASAKNMCTYY